MILFGDSLTLLEIVFKCLLDVYFHKKNDRILVLKNCKTRC
jgi:hypothetical protein